MTKLEKFHADFDGLRKVLRIRSKKKILAVIDTAYKTWDCPLSALRKQATRRAADRLYGKAHEERGDEWFSDWSYSFSPYANEMTGWWGTALPATKRRYLTLLREFYE